MRILMVLAAFLLVGCFNEEKDKWHPSEFEEMFHGTPKQGESETMRIRWNQDSYKLDINANYIGAGFGDLVVSLIRQYGATEISITSRGGSIREAVILSKYIRLNGINTEVRNAESCSSACVMIWLAGEYRTIGDKSDIGFHRSSNPDDSYNKKWCKYMEWLADDNTFICESVMDTPHEYMRSYYGQDIYSMSDIAHELNTQIENPYTGLFGGNTVARWETLDY